MENVIALALWQLEALRVVRPCRGAVQAGSRSGLLSAVSAALTDAGLSIARANVASSAHSGCDTCTFAVHDGATGGRVTDERALQALPALIAEHLDRTDADTEHLALLTRSADIVVVAVGLPELVRCASFFSGFFLAPLSMFLPGAGAAAAASGPCSDAALARHMVGVPAHIAAGTNNVMHQTSCWQVHHEHRLLFAIRYAHICGRQA